MAAIPRPAALGAVERDVAADMTKQITMRVAAARGKLAGWPRFQPWRQRQLNPTAEAGPYKQMGQRSSAGPEP